MRSAVLLSYSRVVRGPGLRGGTKGQVRQGAGEKLAFAQQLSGRVHVGTWAGGNKSLNLRISQHHQSLLFVCCCHWLQAVVTV